MNEEREIECQTTITTGSHAGFDETGALMALFKHGLGHGSITHGAWFGRGQASRKMDGNYTADRQRSRYTALATTIYTQIAHWYDSVSEPL